MSSRLMDSLVRDHLLARATVWVRNELSLADPYHTTCSLQRTRRRTRRNSRVSNGIPVKGLQRLKSSTEAALDANAPVEDEDDANAGPVDSDEESAAVMSALARWKPQPVVPQPVFAPIRRRYQIARLHEQLAMATGGGRTNIFAVKPKPGDDPMGEDAPGEMDMSYMGSMGGGLTRTSSFAPSSRRTSVASRG